VRHRAGVWLLDCAELDDSALSAFEAWLGESERARLRRFVRTERRRQFVAGRALLRQLLAPVFEVAPADVRLLERPGSAPLLDIPARGPVHFSLSHSGPWVACAVSDTTPVGLDIERLDSGRDIEALAAQAFDRAQQRWLRALPPGERLAAFYRMWCEAEARFKLGEAEGGTCHLPHAQLAIALCSAHVLARPPVLNVATFDTAA
jgi:4'-phosphopantetheinyl transferase